MVFGVSRALRHTLTGDNSMIMFGTEGDLLHHWVVAIMLDLNRDWTWDGMADSVPTIERAGAIVGTLELRQTLNNSAFADGPFADSNRRAVTHLIFFDAIDPNPPADEFPKLLSPTWTITPQFKDGVANDGAVQTLNVTLLIAAPPQQTPRIVSAGLAISP